MKRCLQLFMLGILAMFGSVNSAYAYGPFALPIHNNSVEINGGAWNYSSECRVTDEHSGFDFDGEEGDAIYASASGMVIDIKNSDCPNTCDEKLASWGCYVNIGHDVDGDGTYDYTTKYAHIYEGSITVKVGDTVNTNTKIGKMGNTGYSCGAHLHFGVQDYNDCQSLDPSCWLDPYNLYGNATCCDLPNGCPSEIASWEKTNNKSYPDYDCSKATSSNYLWTSCPPTWDNATTTTTTTCTTIASYPIVLTSIQEVAGVMQLSTWYQTTPGRELTLYGSVASGASAVNTSRWFAGNVAMTNLWKTPLA